MRTRRRRATPRCRKAGAPPILISPATSSMLKPKLIVEVGTWLGGSAIHMGGLLRAAGLNDSCILCVDTWLGSSEHYLYPEARSTLKLVDGRPTFYADFMQNVVQHGLQDIILPFSITSAGAAAVLARAQDRAGPRLSRRRSLRARVPHRSRSLLGPAAPRRRA